MQKDNAILLLELIVFPNSGYKNPFLHTSIHSIHLYICIISYTKAPKGKMAINIKNIITI